MENYLKTILSFLKQVELYSYLNKPSKMVSQNSLDSLNQIWSQWRGIYDFYWISKFMNYIPDR